MSRSEAKPSVAPGRVDPRRLILGAARAVLPGRTRHWLTVTRRLARWPLVGTVRFGHLRRVTPISREWGFDRGRPTDRYYIESFLARQSSAIRGRVLEVADSAYTTRFGGDRIARSDVLDLAPTRWTTLVGDLATGAGIPEESFDCIILTQVLHLIRDIRSAIQNSYQALRPGGVLLATLPGISQICRDPEDRWADHWRFTSRSAQQLFEEAFGRDQVHVQPRGNVLTATAFLYGIAAEELKPHELEYNDPDYELLIAVRAEKPGPLRMDGLR
jgi:SAM-dependent methyltransferase